MDPPRRIRRRLERLSETLTIALAIATLLLVVLVPIGTNSLEERSPLESETLRLRPSRDAQNAPSELPSHRG
jgi:hypothetical protein